MKQPIWSLISQCAIDDFPGKTRQQGFFRPHVIRQCFNHSSYAGRRPAVADSPEQFAFECFPILIPDMIIKLFCRILKICAIADQLFHGLCMLPHNRQEGRRHICTVHPDAVFNIVVINNAVARAWGFIHQELEHAVGRLIQTAISGCFGR